MKNVLIVSFPVKSLHEKQKLVNLDVSSEKITFIQNELLSMIKYLQTGLREMFRFIGNLDEIKEIESPEICLGLILWCQVSLQYKRDPL